LHDIGSQDGISFLVMEHLEGETLADRLRRGTPALEEALKIGIQVGRGPGQSACARDRASRFEARQHHAHQKRAEADGLRSGEANRLQFLVGFKLR